MRDINWVKEACFYHIYPLGAFGCPRENKGDETAGHRILNMIDDYNQAAVGQKVTATMPAQLVIRILEEVIWEHGKPVSIRCDNGPEFISHVFQDWCNVSIRCDNGPEFISHVFQD